MPIRTAHTDWTGGLQDGSGTVSLTSSNAATFDCFVPAPCGRRRRGVTSPKSSSRPRTLLLQHAALGGLGRGGRHREVRWTPTPRSASRRTRPAASGSRHQADRARKVDGLDADGFAQAAEKAKATCPVSKALTGTEITLDAALA